MDNTSGVILISVALLWDVITLNSKCKRARSFSRSFKRSFAVTELLDSIASSKRLIVVSQFDNATRKALSCRSISILSDSRAWICFINSVARSTVNT